MLFPLFGEIDRLGPHRVRLRARVDRRLPFPVQREAFVVYRAGTADTIVKVIAVSRVPGVCRLTRWMAFPPARAAGGPRCPPSSAPEPGSPARLAMRRGRG